MPRWLQVYLVVCAALSVVTFIAYALDKRRAAGGGRRVRERTLHAMELLGGWPGGIAARALRRHKSRKLSYRLVSWCIVAAHAALLAWCLWR